jgi:hypothetical protein
VIASSQKLLGTQQLIYGNYVGISETSSLITDAPGFWGFMTVEVKVVEIFPDTYYFPYAQSYSGSHYSQLEYRVARLSVIDSIKAIGMPEEIYLQFPYYSEDVFEGHDSFIMTLSQVGIENFLMINKSKQEITYFPNMFVAGKISMFDIGYGSVIAFKDGTVDASFWEKADHYSQWKEQNIGWFNRYLSDPEHYNYPAGYNSTVDEVKANIGSLDTTSSYLDGYKYLSSADLFSSEESKAIQAYVDPASSNVFAHCILIGKTVGYTRLINGFPTEETFSVHMREIDSVSKGDKSYTPEDLSRVPHIGEALANMDLLSLKPPHIEIVEGMELHYAAAQGFYRKVDGKVYGIIRIIWYYKSYDEFGYLLYTGDDCYYLYDDSGNGSVLERDELRSIIGNDGAIVKTFGYQAAHGELFRLQY